MDTWDTMDILSSPAPLFLVGPAETLAGADIHGTPWAANRQWAPHPFVGGLEAGLEGLGVLHGVEGLLDLGVHLHRHRPPPGPRRATHGRAKKSKEWAPRRPKYSVPEVSWLYRSPAGPARCPVPGVLF